MSKGLSKPQQAVLFILKKKGHITVGEAALTMATLRKPGDSGEMIEKAQYASDIKNISSAYRLMRSLERRGLVAKILGVHGIWISVNRHDNGFGFGSIESLDLPMHVLKKISHGETMSIRVQGQRGQVKRVQNSNPSPAT